MRIAAIYDVHGNLPALEAVLAEIEEHEVDRVVVGGDVMPGPMPVECLERLRGLGTPTDFIRGNGEREVLAAIDGEPNATLPEGIREVIGWVGRSLDPALTEWIAGWPTRVVWEVADLGRVLFCHATPRNDFEIFTPVTPSERLLPAFEGVRADVVVCGHTHMQFERRLGDLRVVNAGSVGMVFGPPGAYWLLLNSGVELRRTPFDLDDAARRILNTAYPQARGFAEANILRPPSRADMIAALEKGAL